MYFLSFLPTSESSSVVSLSCMRREVDPHLPPVQQLLVHPEGLDEGSSVAKVGVAKSLEAAALGVAVAGKSDASDLKDKRSQNCAQTLRTGEGCLKNGDFNRKETRVKYV
jgi:hypothetical protein